MKASCFLLCAALAVASAQPFLPGQGLLPVGNLRTTDGGGPNADGTYNLSLLTTQENQVKAALAFRQDYTDLDLADFAINVECLEGLFDSYGAFGHGFNNNLELGGPTPIGAQIANLSDTVRAVMQEIALSEQGHAQTARAMGSGYPCPQLDFTGGFNDWFAAAFNLPEGTSVEDRYGSAFNPFLNDQNYLLSVVSLEELGATGNLGLSQIALNPVIQGAFGGLATSASQFATAERMLLFNIKSEIVEPFGETVQQVFARISALRDSLDGPQFDDQGLINTDPRSIAVPLNSINLFPTDINGLSFARTPAMIINIQTLGSANGTGVFFPNGYVGRINSPAGYAAMSTGLDELPSSPRLASQESTASLGTVSPPITASGPQSVPNEDILTQWLGGALETESYLSRGGDLSATTSGPANYADGNVDTGNNVATGGR